jgi:LmbE family N-acetylglucosaminyl deacetylase
MSFRPLNAMILISSFLASSACSGGDPTSASDPAAGNAGAESADLLAGVDALADCHAAPEPPSRSERERILVVAPHEDDEVIATAGVVKGALERGDDVRLMMVTTGGVGARAAGRIAQTIAGMTFLGLPQDHILYLGYEESIVLMCAYNNRSAPTAVCPGLEHTQTWAPEGITDYHTMKHGSPAPYDRTSILGDIESIISEFRPQNVYMPAHMERHPDHAASGLFVTEAIIDLQKRARYQPSVNEYMVYRDGLPQSPLNALEPVSNVSANMDATPYAWDNREALPIPKEMFSQLDSGTNQKQLAFYRYLGSAQGYNRFIRTDEIFWKKHMASLSYEARVTTSSETPDHPARNVTDGVALGEPFAANLGSGSNFYDFAVNEWAACEGASRPRVTLSWPRPVLVNEVVLYDRPSMENQVTAGELTFDEGRAISVDALPNNGSPHVVRFAPRRIRQLTFTVLSAIGTPGLSELEVYRNPLQTPSITVTDARDTSIDVRVRYPDELAVGNRLAWKKRGSGRASYLWPDFHIKDGRYFIDGLTPNTTYDVFLLYETPFEHIAHRVRTVETTAPEPPPALPVCQKCTLRLEGATATSLTVTVVYPDSNAFGNRLIYTDLSTGETRDFGTAFAVHDGTYTIDRLTPSNYYDVDLVYFDGATQRFVDNLITAATLSE